MWPLLIGGAVALYLYNKNKQASDIAFGQLPGLYVPTTLVPLSADDVAVARAVINGSYPGTASTPAAQRLSELNEILVGWGKHGRNAEIPDLRTAISYG